MTVEEYICEGICNGCDCDPAQCYNQGYCEYDGKEFEEEKKLTDEEIVKALEYEKEYLLREEKLTGNAYNTQLVYMRGEGVLAILDLIHRLQSDYSNLKERYVKVLDLNEKVIAEQKAEIELLSKVIGSSKRKTKILELQKEIERLKKEHERIAWSKQQYLDWVHGFLATHTDMKDRGEDYKMFDREWMCGVFWAKIEGSIEYIIDLENQRDELQKQVNELTKQREVGREKLKNEIANKIFMSASHGAIQCGKMSIAIAEIEAEKYVEFAWEMVQQSVKDTAKEIYELIDAVKEVFPNDYRGYDMAHGWSMCVDKLKEIIKSKGAEVD